MSCHLNRLKKNEVKYIQLSVLVYKCTLMGEILGKVKQKHYTLTPIGKKYVAELI